MTGHRWLKWLFSRSAGEASPTPTGKPSWIKKDNHKAVASDGSLLQSMDRHFFHYQEAGKTLKVVIEGAPSPLLSGVYLNKNSRWLWPHEQDRISPEKLADLRERIGTALDLLGVAHEFK